jgi:flagellin
MSLFINTNQDSLRARNEMTKRTRTIGVKMERLSSGKRINGASDDAAGLSISTRMESQVRGYDQAVRNTTDGMSLLQTADGALDEVTQILQRMRELSVQAANETYNPADLSSIQSEVSQLTKELGKIAAQTDFNGLKIFSQMSTRFKIQSGDKANQNIELKLSSVRPETLARQAKVNSQGGITAETSLLGDFFGQGLGGDSLLINGVEVRDSVNGDDVTSTIYNYGSAIAKANAINSHSEFTNVTARVGETRTDNQAYRNSLQVFDSFGNSGAITAVELTSSTYMSINDVKIAGFDIEDNDATGSLVSAINAYEEETGVIAHLNEDSELVLVAKDGRNIHLEYHGDNFGRDLETSIGLRDGSQGTFAYAGQVSLESDETIEVDFGFQGNDSLGGMLQNSNPFAPIPQQAVFGVNSEYAVDKINIENKQDAEDAIRTLDLALEDVLSMRGEIGGLHNRLESTVNNLQQTSQNTAVAKSRIMDADFASETADLTKNMMIASGNTSVLAQANQSPSIALELLGASGIRSGLSAGGGPRSIF